VTVHLWRVVATLNPEYAEWSGAPADEPSISLVRATTAAAALDEHEDQERALTGDYVSVIESVERVTDEALIEAVAGVADDDLIWTWYGEGGPTLLAYQCVGWWLAYPTGEEASLLLRDDAATAKAQDERWARSGPHFGS
jgi:hypothetical protein